MQFVGWIPPEKEADLIVCNYVYEYSDGSPTKTICYQNVFPDGKLVTWDQTHHFGASQYLTLHSAIYRTEILRKCGRGTSQAYFL